MNSFLTFIDIDKFIVKEEEYIVYLDQFCFGYIG